MITEKMSLAEVVKEYPQTIPYLNDLHLDYCCGGHQPMDESFTDGSLDLKEVLAELNRIASQPKKASNSQAGTIEAFTEDVFVHVFKENSIVFPEFEEQ